MTFVLKTQPVPLTVNNDGVVLVTGTRIPLDTVVYAFRNGRSPEEIVAQYDVLKLADVHAIISYYLNHQEEIDGYIQQREAEAEAIRQEIDDRFDQKGFRQRLLARRDHNA